MRLIDADALERHVYTEWVNGELSNSEWVDFRQWLKDEPTVEPASPWHRVEEPPKEYGNYLAVVNGEVMEVTYSDMRDDWKWSTCDADGFAWIRAELVTHWMPMPEPPKEDA